MKKALIAAINQAVKASTLEPGADVNNMSWRDLTKKAWKMSTDMDEEFDSVCDLLGQIVALRGSGPALTMNANALLRCAKRMIL